MTARLIRGPPGTWGVLGNHDYGSGWQNDMTARHVVTLAERAGVTILRNELANVKVLTIAGASSGHHPSRLRLPPADPTVPIRESRLSTKHASVATP